MKHLEYKGYSGTIEYSKEDKLLYGKVIGIKALLSYEGSTGTKLEADFKGVIDEYLQDCKELNVKPEKPFKGSFNVRISSELHRDAALKAMELNTSLNSFVSESIRGRLVNVQKKSFANAKFVLQKAAARKAPSSPKRKKLVKK